MTATDAGAPLTTLLEEPAWRRPRVAPACTGALLLALACSTPAAASLLREGGMDVSAPIFAVLGVLALQALVLDRSMRRYRLGPLTLATESGWLVRRRAEVSLAQVCAVATRQGPLQRWFGCGDVLVVAPGAGSIGEPMVGSVADIHRLCLHDVPDHERVADGLRAGLLGHDPPRQ